MKAPSSFETLILPGLGGSGPEHWQTRWEKLFGYARVEQASWDFPDREAWVSVLDTRVRQARRPVMLVAHSLACVLVAHWVARTGGQGVAAAFLVAPADVEDPLHTPPVVRGFAPIPASPFPFPSVVLASVNDPFMTHQRARHFAGCWRAGFVDLCARGHINADSHLDDWPQGHAWLEALQIAAGLGSESPCFSTS
jgi:predicted alpha/beta hydrolase family esterase